ncbi:hypothetical protein GUITHDRAFT_120357 [Guillardia theta CCMP2712]|uniref:Uncharacterized protein n=1 Tax=Guillardia theta (strain CCMP2712) TaxID=905079 RepID=L1IC04_GUITC|nr:hypothetical protein GUITHDRAFT_120357 [Guillardia theta CCMP2712]EKX33454.1 hypothetical protein GUITHDRAFT_120357 [Guillardia theta CCMP2712]|eukprot:XP_005820434.1 hypothetical protein GUITHDRAFT_120357 [Guillardia theta CCMP2712]
MFSFNSQYEVTRQQDNQQGTVMLAATICPVSSPSAPSESSPVNRFLVAQKARERECRAEQKRKLRREQNALVARLDELLPDQAKTENFKGVGHRSLGSSGRSLSLVLQDACKVLRSLNAQPRQPSCQAPTSAALYRELLLSSRCLHIMEVDLDRLKVTAMSESAKQYFHLTERKDVFEAVDPQLRVDDHRMFQTFVLELRYSAERRVSAQVLLKAQGKQKQESKPSIPAFLVESDCQLHHVNAFLARTGVTAGRWNLAVLVFSPSESIRGQQGGQERPAPPCNSRMLLTSQLTSNEANLMNRLAFFAPGGVKVTAVKRV